MPWTLIESQSSSQGQETNRYVVQPHQNYFIEADSDNRLSVQIAATQDALQLAQIRIGPWGVRLKTFADDIAVVPAKSRVDPHVEPSSEEYKLRKQTNGTSEVIFLREGDQIYLSKVTAVLKLVWNDAEVQVNSSVTALEAFYQQQQQQETAGANEESHAQSDDQSDTEDDDLDNQTAVTTHTPNASVAQSEVVQETPHIDRVTQLIPNDVSLDGNPDDTSTMVITVETTNPPDHAVADATMSVPAAANDESATNESLIEASLGKNAYYERYTPSVSPRRDRPIVQTTPETSRKRTTPMSEPESPLRSGKRLKTSTTKDQSTEAAPLDATRPSSSTRSSQASKDDPLVNPRVAFSNTPITDLANIMRFLKSQGGTKVESVQRNKCSILCVNKGPLKKSGKLLLAIALGIPIVTQTWLTESARAGHLLDLQDFMPRVPGQEREFGFKMSDVWGVPQKDLLVGKVICFTPALKATYKPFKEVEQLCKMIGATKVVSKPPKEGTDTDAIILALDAHDPDLSFFIEGGCNCYSKDLLATSILRGKLNLDSEEFKLAPIESEAPQRRGRSRKG